jgi:hypothetical protein
MAVGSLNVKDTAAATASKEVLKEANEQLASDAVVALYKNKKLFDNSKNRKR